MTAVAGDEVARGQLIRLRRKRLSDARQDYEWRRDPELARFDAASPLRSGYFDFLAAFEDDLHYPSPFRRSFAVESVEGRHIGNIMYYNYDPQRGEVELGITIGDRAYWGRGYGRDTVRAFAGLVFRTLQVDRIVLNTLDWNIRAQHSFIAAGFRPCGTQRRGPHTFVTMEHLRAWLESGPPPSGTTE